MTGLPADVEDDLARYLAGRDAARDRHVVNAWNSLSLRERRLVKEAAVMGYVRGVQDHGPYGAKIPPDSQVIYAVIAYCQSNSSRFPFIGNLTRRRKTRQTRVQTEGANPT